MKKIILEATALILGTIIIISGTQVSSLKIYERAFEIQTEDQKNNNMIFFGFGLIEYLTIDGKYYVKGEINGNISIENKRAPTVIPYFLFIKDRVNNKIELKWSLSEEFVLKNFSGVGKIHYYQAPHGPDWAEFFLIGTFEKIITGYMEKKLNSSGFTISQELFQDNSFKGTYKYYYDVNILMISKLYESIEIDGFHQSNSGKGHDKKITLQDANKILTLGIAIIWNDTEIKEWAFNGGWWHTKVEIFNYYGWIVCQSELYRMKMFGDCEKIKITVYRS